MEQGKPREARMTQQRFTTSDHSLNMHIPTFDQVGKQIYQPVKKCAFGTRGVCVCNGRGGGGGSHWHKKLKLWRDADRGEVCSRSWKWPPSPQSRGRGTRLPFHINCLQRRQKRDTLQEYKMGYVLRNTSVNSKISLFSSPKRPSSTKLEEHARDQLEMHGGGLSLA